MMLENWATSALAAVVLFLANISRTAHEKSRTVQDQLQSRVDLLEDRLYKIELMSVTEGKVREILKENLDPIAKSSKSIEDSIIQIKIELASMPKRRSDPS